MERRIPGKRARALLAILVAAVMAFGMIPAPAFAAGANGQAAGSCAATEGCTLGAGHEGECVLPAEDGEAAGDDGDSRHEAGGTAEPDGSTAEETLAEMISALPDPAEIDPADEEQVKAVNDQISAIYAFAEENGLGDRENGLLDEAVDATVNAVIAALYPAEPLADPQVISEDTTWNETMTLSGNLTVNEGKTLTIGAQVTIKGNVTISGGGTIKRGEGFATYMIVVPEDSSLTLNSVTIDGGAVWSEDPDTTLKRGTTNSGIAAKNAMIFNAGKLTINEGSTLQNNSNEMAPVSGAPWGPTVGENTTASILTADELSSSGGAVMSVGAVEMTGGTVKDNQAYGGAGIYSFGSLTMTGGSITKNYTKNYDDTFKYAQGAGIAVGGNRNWNEKKNGWEQGSYKTTISGGEITANVADGNGGGIAVFTCGLLEVKDGAKITSNVSGANGGGVYTWTASALLSGGEISDNEAINGGGVAFTNASVGTVSGSEISKNTATSGGGLYVSFNSTGTVSGGKISDNKATNGGGLYLYSEGSTAVVSDNGSIANNVAENNGGGIYVMSGTLNVTGGNIHENTAGSDNSNSNCTGGGIAVYAWNGNAELNIDGGSISGNQVVSHNARGGGVCIGSGNSNYTITLNMTGGSIGAENLGNKVKNSTNGSDALYGAGLYVESYNNTTANISGGSISYNELNATDVAAYGAGMMFNGNSKNSISGTAVISNNIIITNNQAAAGAGVYVRTNATVTMNGGAISQNIVKMADTLQDGKQPQNGGGGVEVRGTFTMNDGTIESNVADGYWNGGGGVRVNGGTFTMNGGTVQNNIACNSKAATYTKGGAFYVLNNGNLEINGGTITGNAGCMSGAITFINGPYARGTVTITGGKITGNYCTNDNGGAIYMPSATNGTQNNESYTFDQTVNISGNPVIVGNYKGATISTTNGYSVIPGSNLTEQNIYLADNSEGGGNAADSTYAAHQTLVLTGPLTGGATIGVTTQNKLTSSQSSAIQITTAEDGTNYYEDAAQYFIPDAADVKAQENASSKYIELAYDSTVSSQKKLTFELDGVNISGSTIVRVGNSGTYSLTLVPEAGYTLPDSITENDITVGESGTKPTCKLSPVDGSAQLTISGISEDATISLKGVLKDPKVQTSGNVSKSYDGEDITLTVTPFHEASGVTYTYQWKKGDEEIADATSASYTLTAPGVTGENGDTYTCTVTAKDGSGRTATTTASITVEITAADIKGIAVTAYNGFYDGNTHSVEATVPDGFEIQYAENENGNYSNEAPTFTDVGEHTVYWRVEATGNNYKTASGSVVVAIAKADQSMSYAATKVDKHIGDAVFTNELTKTTVFDAVTYSSSNTSVATVDANGQVTIKGAGETTITATAAGTANYNSATAAYTLTVSDRGYGEYVSNNDATWIPATGEAPAEDGDSEETAVTTILAKTGDSLGVIALAFAALAAAMVGVALLARSRARRGAVRARGRHSR